MALRRVALLAGAGAPAHVAVAAQPVRGGRATAAVAAPGAGAADLGVAAVLLAGGVADPVPAAFARARSAS